MFVLPLRCFVFALLLGLCLCGLSACGQKGALFIPEEPVSASEKSGDEERDTP